MANDKDYRNSGYINITWNDTDKLWTVGGSYTDHTGKEWDLGWVKTGSQNIQEAIAIVGKQLGPTIAGKGIPRKPRDQGTGPKGGPQ